MSLATSMKNLVDNIHASKTERHSFVKDMSKDVKELLARFNKEQEDLIKELKEMSAEVKKFLANGEKTRKEGEKARKEDFVAMMGTITARLEDIAKWQKDVRKDAQKLIKECAADLKKAKEYWFSLSVADEKQESRGKQGRAKKEGDGKE
ncbi:MAG: hypothetical protein V1770_06450 [bacterium]